MRRKKQNGRSIIDRALDELSKEEEEEARIALESGFYGISEGFKFKKLTSALKEKFEDQLNKELFELVYSYFDKEVTNLYRNKNPESAEDPEYIFLLLAASVYADIVSRVRISLMDAPPIFEDRKSQLEYEDMYKHIVMTKFEEVVKIYREDFVDHLNEMIEDEKNNEIIH